MPHIHTQLLHTSPFGRFSYSLHPRGAERNSCFLEVRVFHLVDWLSRIIVFEGFPFSHSLHWPSSSLGFLFLPPRHSTVLYILNCGLNVCRNFQSERLCRDTDKSQIYELLSVCNFSPVSFYPIVQPTSFQCGYTPRLQLLSRSKFSLKTSRIFRFHSLE